MFNIILTVAATVIVVLGFMFVLGLCVNATRADAAMEHHERLEDLSEEELRYLASHWGAPDLSPRLKYHHDRILKKIYADTARDIHSTR